MSYQAKFHARAGSRSSISSVTQMPVISEHGRSPMPSPPLRVPQKQSRKNGGGGARGSVTPPPPYAAFSVPNGNPTNIHPPPAAVLHADPRFAGDPEKMMLGDIKLDSSSVEGQDPEQERSDWNREHRRRRCRFVGLVAFLVVITLGLGIGLSLGLSYSGTSDGESTEFGDASMTGSFSFDTTLQQISTGCTSNPTTWRCFPYSSGVVTEFQWAIKQDDNDDYRISSLSIASPASHAFSNVPLTLLDSSLPTERFVFSFQMNKTVVPSAALASPSSSSSSPKPSQASSSSSSSSKPSHAASCTYTNATFQGTLWTRAASLRHRPRALQRRQDSEFPKWPGLIEITELVDSKRGGMTCHDSEGAEIGGMRAVEGTCGCLYRTPERS